MIELPGGVLLIHTEQKGWFMGRAEGGKLAVTPAGDADTGRVFQMKQLGSAVLIWARNGLFVGRAAGGKVIVAPAGAAETGQLFQMRDFAGGLLISAERGLFFAREQDGKVTIASVGSNTGPAQAEGIHDLPGGGTLIQARKEWFVARAAGGKVTLTSAGTTDPGRISLMRNFGGGVLVGAERGVFVATAGLRKDATGGEPRSSRRELTRPTTRTRRRQRRYSGSRFSKSASGLSVQALVT